MSPAQLAGSTFRGGLLRGAIAGGMALLVLYGVLFFTSDEPAVTATAPCENGTAVPNPEDNPGLVSDCAILLGARDTLRGTANLRWLPNRAITGWEGITVSGTPGRVTELRLDRNTLVNGRRITLTGTIPPELGGLSKLQSLHLTRHELSGPIPVELANLSDLTNLQLHGNDLTGGIPAELGNLSNLTHLALSTNPLGGVIPVELGKLANLLSLRLENNQLTGAIPGSLTALSNLTQLSLYGNTGLTGCIPTALRDVALNDLRHLGLSYCTTTTTYTLTTSVTGSGRTSPLPGTYRYLSGDSVTVTATPDAGHRVASWGGDCSASGTATTCSLTMSANRTASVTFERITYTLTVTAGAGGSVTPEGTSTQNHGDEVTLTASWDDATHTFGGWGGDCSGTETTCDLTMDAAKTVTATFTALAADRCATTTATDCIRAVYLGAPGDYAQVQDIPADLLLTANSDGRYYVERGQQVTVVTAAPLPTGWKRFYLDQTPLGTPSPVSASQLIKPIGTTYTFTVTTDPGAATLITFDLTAARPFVRPRPDGKPELGDTVVSTVFSVEAETLSYDTYDTTGAVTTPGSYAFLSDPDDTSTAVITYEALRDGTATALLIHKSDAHGASQATLYDAVEAGDLFEWHKADDCFVRYRVTEAPEPDATASQREFGVRWETYVFQGCQTGSLPTSAAVKFTAAAELPLEHLGGTNLTDFAVVHGPWQLTQETQPTPGGPGSPPAGVAVKPPELTAQPARFETPSRYQPGQTVTSMAEVRQLPYWREPTVPAGWTFTQVRIGGGNSSEGYEAVYFAPAGSYPAVSIWGIHAHWRHLPEPASWLTNHTPSRQGVHELRVVAGRPALVAYSPLGPRHHPTATVTVRVYDPATESIYIIMGRSGSLGLRGGPAAVERLLVIARSLFQGPNSP